MPTPAPHLDSLIIGKARTHAGLTVFPLCLTAREFQKYPHELIPLGDALANGNITATETGRMETITLAAHRAAAFAIAGETLIGGAQNRLINYSSLIPAGAKTELTASCVEVKRWEIPCGATDIPSEIAAFRTSSIAFPALRRIQMRSASKGSPTPDQKAVWSAIVELFNFTRAPSATLDLHDLYTQYEPLTKDITARFAASPNQTGMIAFTGRGQWIADIFGSSALFLAHYRQLLKSAAFESVIHTERQLPATPAPDAEFAARILKSLRLPLLHPLHAPVPNSHSQYYSFAAKNFFGTLLATPEGLVQLAAASRAAEK